MFKPHHLSLTIILLFNGVSPFSNAQVVNLPYSQDFETPIQQSPAGCKKDTCIVEFLPGWIGNEVQKSSRIYLDSVSEPGNSAIGLIPLSSFNPEVKIQFARQGTKGLSVDFQVSSFKNGGEKDTRPSVLYISASQDGGVNFTNEVELDTFRNEKSINYKTYHYEVLIEEKSAEIITLKFKAIRTSLGTGQASKILLDNFSASALVLAANKVIEKEAGLKVSSNNGTSISFNKVTSGCLYDALSRPIFKINNVSCIETTSLPNGIYLFKSESGELLKIIF